MRAFQRLVINGSPFADHFIHVHYCMGTPLLWVKHGLLRLVQRFGIDISHFYVPIRFSLFEQIFKIRISYNPRTYTDLIIRVWLNVDVTKADIGQLTVMVDAGKASPWLKETSKCAVVANVGN